MRQLVIDLLTLNLPDVGDESAFEALTGFPSRLRELEGLPGCAAAWEAAKLLSDVARKGVLQQAAEPTGTPTDGWSEMEGLASLWAEVPIVYGCDALPKTKGAAPAYKKGAPPLASPLPPSLMFQPVVQLH